MRENEYDGKTIFDLVSENWIGWTKHNSINPTCKWVIAVSGGKDSSVTAALAAKIFGKDNVIGLTLPCDGQKDFNCSMKLIEHLGIRHVNIDIGDAVYGILSGIENNSITPSYDTKTNLPARIRMAVTYAVAQSVDGIVLNTANLTESVLGYCTLFGDDCGSYAPLKGLTVTEVIRLGEFLGLPDDLVHKTPIDGLQPLSDEEKLGMKYSEIDDFIRFNEGTDELKERVVSMYKKNKFKTDIIDVPGPSFSWLGNYYKKDDN